MNLFKKVLRFSTVFITFYLAVSLADIDDDTVTFYVVPGLNLPVFNATHDEDLSSRGCNPSGKFSIIVHGWLESFNTEWVQDLISNLTEYRGGCIIVMDYSNYSVNLNYFLLTPHFANLSDMLLRFMVKMEDEGFDFGKGFMFGFSFGAQLAITTATKFGTKRFKEIDAGPGFEHLPMSDASLAAENVQCIHTSNTYGTMKRNCTQNWNMGYCGWSQVGAMPFPKGSHGLCPIFYNVAFQHTFLAWENVYNCPSKRAAGTYPEEFKMGYMEGRKSKVAGDLFSPTSVGWPFNRISGRQENDDTFIHIQEAEKMELSLLHDASNYIQKLEIKSSELSSN
ncbi:CLUMA_CG018755, isoform A [Clunio marinus]|uniref:CLUMA_CG018755, isoform A n=1 Tax=Clunio marinus TaxID=568069 RepID=A0A1J1IZT9_9DIPT|nr:CLUMA_CG018755, isoform A [Clunio marinus]